MALPSNCNSGFNINDSLFKSSGDNNKKQEDNVNIRQRDTELRASTSGANEETIPLQVSKIVQFFNGLPGPRDLTINDILSFDDKNIETSHDIVQWLFPLNEKSNYNFFSPILTSDDICVLSTHKYQDVLARNISRFMDFYGVACDEEFQVINFSKKFWITAENHNLKRITRIIRCCKILGLENVSNNLNNGFQSLSINFSHVVTKEVSKFWNDAATLSVDCKINK